MPKLKLSGPQKEIVEVLAHIMAASKIAAADESMRGFFDDYIRNTLTDRQRAIYGEMKNRSIQICLEIADMLEKEDK